MEQRHRARGGGRVAFVVTTAAAVLVLAAGCGEVTTAESAGPFLGSTYTSTGVTRYGEPVELEAGTGLTLTFTSTGASASAGCNTMMATGGIEDGVLVLDKISGTEMACDPAVMEQEFWWGQFLTSRPTVEVAERQLRLTSPEAEVTMVSDQRPPDLPLQGTAWALDTIISGDTASSVPVPAGLTFDASAMTVVVDSCRTTEVAVTVTDGTLTFDPTAFATSGCTGDAATVDQAVTAVLGQGSAGYVIDSDRLTVTAPDGSSLVCTGS